VPHGPLRVILGEARVPVGLEKHVPAVQDSEFIIWRTKLDSDVRKTHLAKEGVSISQNYGSLSKGTWL
jgi:hypothetical protein